MSAHRQGGIAAALAFAVSAGLSLAPDANAQVQRIIVSKGIEHTQTSATGVAITPVTNPCHGCPYSFGANVEGTNLASLTPPVVSGPVNAAAIPSFWHGGQLLYNTSDGSWRLGYPNADDWSSATAAERNSLFGNGTYTFTVNGATVALNLTGDAYPNTPYVTLTGGSWAGGKYEIDPGRPLTITTNAFAAYGSHPEDAIALAVEGVGETLQFHSASPNSNTVTITVPANTFVAGREYAGWAAFIAAVDVRPHASFPGSLNAAIYTSSTGFRIKAVAPVFPMTVTSSIGPTVSSATANIQYRAEDVGKTASVYTFAMAPESLVTKSAGVTPLVVGKSKPANGSKDTPVACVLAQLNSSGQLQAVSIAGLQAYVSGVLSAQGQAVKIIDGIATANIAGSTFFVGYGSDPTAMMASGVNRSAVTVPGSATCRPQPPQTGWWWNQAEDGRGYTIESTGSKIFFAAYLYDVTGRSTWYIAAGNTSLDGSLFVGNLESYSNGQTLTGAFRSPVRPPVLNGQVTLAFNDSTHGSLIWPGGTVPITRMEFGVGGVNAVPQEGQPENGWWLSGVDDGRGFFIEWQAGVAFMAGFMYDDTGAPVWYIAANPRSDNARAFSSQWEKYVNGQTLTGTYHPPVRPPTYVGAATIQFQGADTAIMTMPGGRQVNLSRYRF